jgi:epoxyqueuosine reductase QueG
VVRDMDGVFMQHELKDALIVEMKRVGAYEVRVADPHKGFGHAPEGRHPHEIMPDYRSVVTFVIPRADIPDCFYVGVRRSQPQAPDRWTRRLHTRDVDMYLGQRLAFLFTAYVILKAVSFLSEKGFKAVERWDKARPGQPLLPEKLCAYEAGLGIYGRSGMILHPELGNRIVIGSLLTDARLEPDGKLECFDPCTGCEACIRACPAGAYGEDGSYHGAWSSEKCQAKRAELMKTGHSMCNLCWDVCHAGSYSHDDLFVMGIGRKRPLSRLAKWIDSIHEKAGVAVTPGTLK